MNVQATYENGENPQAPRPSFDEGDVLHIFDYVDVWMDGHEQSRYVENAEILSVDLDLVVREQMWHLHYRVALFEDGELVTTELLTEDQIQEIQQ